MSAASSTATPNTGTVATLAKQFRANLQTYAIIVALIVIPFLVK